MSISNEAHVIKFLQPKNITILLMIPLSLFCSITVFNPVTIINSYSQEETIKLTAIFAEPKERWDVLIEKALKKLNEIHPNKKIQIEYSVLPYSDTRTQILTAMAGKSELDLVSLDQIWLGEFAEAGFLTDITEKTKVWNKSSDWYENNWLGGIYKDKVYGIWAWTDVRALWYWKDLLNQSGLSPEKLKTWDGYLQGFKILSEKLPDKNIQPIHLTSANHVPDMWYPYLWMLGGNILELRDGHPSKGNYWFPTYNSKQGVMALEFLRDQINTGIKPQINHFWGQEFADKKFAVMLEGSWILGHFSKEEWKNLKEKIGLITMFPVPNNTTKTSTMMGGWLFSIPETSKHKDLAWELITIMLDPDVLMPMLLKEGYLPTQKSVAEGIYSKEMKSTIPYYEDLISLIPYAKGRPNIPEYPQIADHIRTAIEEVYQGADPKQSLDKAVEDSMKVLGWK